MRKALSVIVVGICCVCPTVVAEEWSNTLKSYDCLEVHKFAVDREDYSSKKLERAGTIPEEALEHLQHKVVGEVTRGELFPKVSKTECSGKTLVFGGKVTDFKKGSRSARIWIGMGAGKQKFEVQCYLKDKATGKVLRRKEIIDRKIGGWAGGDEAKGESDFAEKVAKFVRHGK